MLEFLESIFTLSGALIAILVLVVAALAGIVIWRNRKLD
jgi:hypothetical protein